MKITICACSSRTFIDRTEVAKLAASAKQAGMEVTLVNDLCELCENQSEAVHDIAATTIVACHPRAVKSLMAFAGVGDVQSFNLRTRSADEVLEALGVPSPAVSSAATAEWMQQLEAMPRKLGEDAWYPALDKDVCAECGNASSSVPLVFMRWLTTASVSFIPSTAKTTVQPVPAPVQPAPSFFPSTTAAPSMEAKSSRRVQSD